MTLRFAGAALVMIAVGVGLDAQGQLSEVSLARSESREFTSKVNGRSYRVRVSLPEAYSQDQSARFPVLYLTDADWVFALTAQTHVLLRIGKFIPEAIVVGISPRGAQDTRSVAAARVFDLTPTQVAEQERDLSKRYEQEVRTGGAAAFLRVLREELIPDTERRYRTTPDRTYIGYSLGGLFGAYALFQAPETFGRMVLVSPSLWWDNNQPLKLEERFATTHKSLPVRLFMSDGELETSMIANMTQMAAALENRHYEGLQLQTRIFPGESHMTTYPVAITRGLQAVFAAKPTS